MTTEYVDTKQAAQQLRVSVFTVRQLIRAGQLPGTRMRGAHTRGGYLIPTDSLAKYIATLPEAPTTEVQP